MVGAPNADRQLRVEQGVLSVSGALTVSSVTALLPQGRRAIACLSADRAVLDLAGVSASDSSGLALVVDWLRTARERKLTLSVRNVPSQMAALATVSGLDALLSDGDTNAS